MRKGVLLTPVDGADRSDVLRKVQDLLRRLQLKLRRMEKLDATCDNLDQQKNGLRIGQIWSCVRTPRLGSTRKCVYDACTC
jgi:hypothetical protein